MGSAHVWERTDIERDFDRFTGNEAAFIAARDSFYMASVSESGWPYVQHRGGPPGFLKLLDERRLAFADYRGNRQYISAGNLRANTRVALILMDYAKRTRLKIYARAETLPAGSDPELEASLAMPGYRARAERIFVLTLEAFDWNCPQHITLRFSEAEIREGMREVRERMTELETQNARLRAELAKLNPNGVR